MIKRPIIIDTDPGIDDFFCLMLAGANRDIFDLRAITCIGGNSSLETVVKNALNIENFFNLETKVAIGSVRALMFEFEKVDVHGPTGLGNTELPKSPKSAVEKKAWDVIYDEALLCGGELELVPIGPLTNIALAILKYPEITKMIKKITIMGGSTNSGNCNAYGEANIYHDPHAAEVVFKSGIPIVMCGLNATAYAPLNFEETIEYAAVCREDIKEAVSEIATFRGSEPYHDCITLATMIDPDMAVYKDYYVEVECRSKMALGQTIVDFNNVLGKEPNTSVIMSVDKEKYRELIKKMMKFYS